MTLRQNLLAQLAATIGKQHQQITVTLGPRTLRCEIDQCDPLAVAVYELALETPELANIEVANLQAASQSLCERVTYLLEPITPIETDADSCVVQMRSTSPQQHEKGRYYYELLLRRGGSVTLARYEKQPGTLRQRIPATLTQEVLARLAEDFDLTIDDALSH